MYDDFVPFEIGLAMLRIALIFGILLEGHLV